MMYLFKSFIFIVIELGCFSFTTFLSITNAEYISMSYIYYNPPCYGTAHPVTIIM